MGVVPLEDFIAGLVSGREQSKGYCLGEEVIKLFRGQGTNQQGTETLVEDAHLFIPGLTCLLDSVVEPFGSFR